MPVGRFAGEKFNILNPFTYGNLGKAIDKTRSGDPNVEYEDSQVGVTAERANERNQLLRNEFRRKLLVCFTPVLTNLCFTCKRTL